MSKVDYQNKVLPNFFFKFPSLKQTRPGTELMRGVCLSSSSGNEEDYMQVCVI